MKTEKTKYPWELASAVGLAILEGMKPLCKDGMLTIAGSVRRKKAEVSDLEIVYVPLIGSNPSQDDFFGTPVNLVSVWLDDMVNKKGLCQRLNILGQKTWGDRIKLATQVGTGLPVDFFEANIFNWHNYLVCRTGPKESNMAIANAAQARGWQWRPYSPGFTRMEPPHELHQVRSEAEVFEFVGLKHVPPAER